MVHEAWVDGWADCYPEKEVDGRPWQSTDFLVSPTRLCVCWMQWAGRTLDASTARAGDFRSEETVQIPKHGRMEAAAAWLTPAVLRCAREFHGRWNRLTGDGSQLVLPQRRGRSLS